MGGGRLVEECRGIWALLLTARVGGLQRREQIDSSMETSNYVCPLGGNSGHECRAMHPSR